MRTTGGKLRPLCVLFIAALLAIPGTGPFAMPHKEKQHATEDNVKAAQAVVLEAEMDQLKVQLMALMQETPLTEKHLAVIEQMEADLHSMQKQFAGLVRPEGEAVARTEAALATATFCSTTIPRAIPPVGSGGAGCIPGTDQFDDTITVPGPAGMIVSDVNVKLYATHAFDSDLEVRLIHGTTTVALFTNVGGSGDNFGSTCAPMPNCVIDDEATTDIGAGAAPFVGSFNPEGAAVLSAFDGPDQMGAWTLRVCDNASGDVGSLVCWCVEITTIVAPPNDNCASAITATCPPSPFIDTQNTLAATNEAGEPVTTCGSTSPATQSNSVWYKYTPPADQQVTISTAGSNYDTVVQVYTGSCGAFVPCVCDDDNGPGSTSLASFVARAGVLYLIKVADFGNPGGGTLMFSLSCAALTVANDLCSNATAVTFAASGGVFTACVDTTGAAAGNECGETGLGSKSVWWKVTAAKSGFLDLGTFGTAPPRTRTNFDTTIQVRTACPPGGALLAANNDDFVGDLRSRVVIPVTAGQMVFVRVAGFGGASGTACVRFVNF